MLLPARKYICDVDPHLSLSLALQVSDFGQARPLMDTTSVHHMGTHLWSAPEVLAEEGQSQKSDIFSFGCTAVEMFSEKEPYYSHHKGDRRQVKKVLRKVEDRELVSLRECWLKIEHW